MNRNIITLLLIITTIIVILGILIKINNKNNNVIETVADAEEIEYTETEELNEIAEIQIYDIEEGYLTVPYNSDANKHEYNWDNLTDLDSGLYKYEDDKYYSKLGVDVSSHQGIVDWEKVRAEGIDFAILRIGYRGYGQAGKLCEDSMFEENYNKAKEYGIEIGAYFFSQAVNIDEVKEEAEMVLEKLKGKEITYPVSFDLEKIKNDTARTDNLTNEEIDNMTLEFCKIMEENGYTPCIYANAKTFTTRMQLDRYNKYQKWYADYQTKPLYPYEFTIWQYTETGRIDGINGGVDINLQFLSR